MRIINAGGFNKTERKQWRAIIFNNLVSAFQTIFAAMQEQETDFEDDDNLVGRLERNVCGKLTLAALR
jgi:guanine nucleotide-binding protein subunit alpha